MGISTDVEYSRVLRGEQVRILNVADANIFLFVFLASCFVLVDAFTLSRSLDSLSLALLDTPPSSFALETVLCAPLANQN